MWVKNCIIAPPFDDGWMFVCNSLPIIIRAVIHSRDGAIGGKTRLRLLAEQTRQQRNQGDAYQSDTAASHELLHALRLY